jgi:hypothetical protein
MKSVTKTSLAATAVSVLLITALAFTLNANTNKNREGMNQSAAEATGRAATLNDTQNRNIAGYTQLLHENLTDEKEPVLGSVLQLTPEEAAKFWPIFDQYNAELNKLNASAAASIDAYIKGFPELSAQQADDMVQKSVEYHNQREALLSKYYGLVKEALGPATAARFFEIENQILLLIELQMNSNLPVAD